MATTDEAVCKGGAMLLRAIRAENMTLEQAEREADVSAGYLSRVLRGSRKMNTLPIALRLEARFKIPVEAWGVPVDRQAKASHARRLPRTRRERKARRARGEVRA